MARNRQRVNLDLAYKRTRLEIQRAKLRAVPKPYNAPRYRSGSRGEYKERERVAKRMIEKIVARAEQDGIETRSEQQLWYLSLIDHPYSP